MPGQNYSKIAFRISAHSSNYNHINYAKQLKGAEILHLDIPHGSV